MPSSTGQAAAAPDRVPIVLAVRMRDFRVVSSEPSDAGLPQLFKELTWGVQATGPLSASSSSPGASLGSVPPWVRLLVHQPACPPSESPSHDANLSEPVDTGTRDESPSPSPPEPSSSTPAAVTRLAEFSSEDALVVARPQAAFLEWPDFDPTFSLTLPSLGELPATRWRGFLSRVTVTAELCATTGEDHGDGCAPMARCHFTLAQLLLDTYPHQPVRAVLHEVHPRPSSTRTGADESAGSPPPLAVQFFVEAQQVQSLRVLLTAVALRSPVKPAFLTAATAAATAAAEDTALPAAAGSTLPPLLALQIVPHEAHEIDQPRTIPYTETPICWADRQDLGESEFRWTALPLVSLPAQTLQDVEDSGIHGAIYVRQARPPSDHTALSTPTAEEGVMACGRFSFHLSAFITASLRQAADARSGSAVSRSAIEGDPGDDEAEASTCTARGVAVPCSQTFRSVVRWSSSALAAPYNRASTRPNTSSVTAPAVIQGIVEVQSLFAYVQKGGAEYGYPPEILEAAHKHPAVTLSLNTGGRVQPSAHTDPRRRLAAPASSATSSRCAPHSLPEESQVIDRVVAQQEALIESIRSRMEVTRRQREAVLTNAAERRERAAAERTAAVIRLKELTAELASQQAAVAKLEAALEQVRQEQHKAETAVAERAAERRLLVSRAASERHELSEIRRRLVAQRDKMAREMHSLSRQATLAHARVEGMLMDSVMNDSGVE